MKKDVLGVGYDNIKALQFIVRSYSHNAVTFSGKHSSYLHQIFACTIAEWFVHLVWHIIANRSLVFLNTDGKLEQFEL